MSDERLLRLGEGMQFIQLMTRAFATLRLTDRASICDTLNALVGSFFDCLHYVTLLSDEAGVISVAAAEGLAQPDALVDANSQRFFTWVMNERTAQVIPSDVVRDRWPTPSRELADGFACAVLELMDAPAGLLVVAHKRSRQDFGEEELTFLACAAGVASMAVANASMMEDADAQRRLAEARAFQAAEEAAAKQRALTELDNKLAIIAQQRAAILELSTPILQIWDDVVALPIIGIIDTQRGEQIMERLLDVVSRRRARFVILDVTGVEMVDTRTADHFLRVARSAALLGATCVMTGIQPAVAQTLVTLGTELGSLVTKATIGEGLAECIRRSRARKAAQSSR
jgi:rsbT co-antagonist protein RsbR